MDAVTLCEFCKEINFEALRNPLISDLPAFREGQVDRSRHPFKDKGNDTHKATILGSFGDILQRSKICRLCQLIGDTLTRQEARRRPGDKDICRVETSYFGIYRDPQERNYWVRRLSICVDVDSDTNVGGPEKSLFHVFQACDIGAASVQVDERFTDPRPGVDMMVYGGRRRPLQLDLGWVRRWIAICKTEHGIACGRPDIDTEHKLKRIRFVDAEQMCVVTLEDVHLSEEQYIALSYVWGGPQELKLEGHNKDALAKPGALVAKTLPKTIGDSILLVTSLGFRYIWIDALCIIQDDKVDQGMQIGAMGQIYNFAFLTIVAASADSVEGGLPGIRPGSRSSVQEEVVVLPASTNGANGDVDPGLSLMSAFQPLVDSGHHYLEYSPWNARGWTMQERLLSRRVLVFMPEQVYWVCREATFCEESYFENSSLRFHRCHEKATELTLRRSFRNFYEPDDDQLRFWKMYQTLITRYTRRSFSFQGDFFDGFRAAIEGLSALSGEDFTWGIPRSHFEQGLLWTSFTGLQRRKEVSTLPMSSLQINVPFPSWSWMGWVGEAFVCIGDERCDEDLGEYPEILCFEHYHDPLRLERARHGTALYDATEEQGLPTWKRSHDQLVTLGDLETEHPQLLSAKLGKIPETQLIFFWTSSAFFTLVPPENKDGRGHSTIVDSSGEVVGSTGTMVSGDWKSDGSGQGRYEFVVLGSRQNPYSDPVLLVLQIEWRDGIAYRINCGEIETEAWERGTHAWKLIPLG